ncbi:MULTISPECIES: hypothetical protein [Rhizobium]|uniref:hypothetical protein n=1 Tax=Rhizobium TaxID=379 RepID=UPI0003729ED9|nr:MULTISPECIES: hypothetical protein [Rhizobium]UFW79625.1 hypothetical protein RlegSU303_06745 [Rhizobium leguminosarum bv. viciae]
MAGAIYTIKLGADNYFKQECQQLKIAGLMLDKPYFDAWSAGDRDAHLAVHLARADMEQSESTIKSESTRWFNYATKIANSVDDIFINIDGDSVTWARSISTTSNKMVAGEPVLVPHTHPTSGAEIIAVGARVNGWSDLTASGVKLQLKTIHKRAQDYIVKLSALSPIADDDMRLYLETLLMGGDVSHWHKRPDWKQRQEGTTGNSLVMNSSLLQKGITELVMSIKGTVDWSNGQRVLNKLKDKKLEGCTLEQMAAHLEKLWFEQKGNCKLTGLKMHLPGQPGEIKDLLVSPDRIDSNGHYTLTNVQLVCRFANFWKLASDDQRFRDLLDMVVQQKIEDLGI